MYFSATPLKTGILLSVFAIALLCGCEDPKKHQSSKRGGETTQKLLNGGDLVFSDDFERESVGDSYTSTIDRWTINKGWVHIQGARNEGLWLKKTLPERARIEFNARSESVEGDLKVELFATKPSHQDGYVLIFGGWKNQLNVIARLDEHGKDRKEIGAPKVKRGKSYHFAVIKSGKQLSWYLDGELVMTYVDPNPLKGRYFGFNNWETPVYYDNLKIYDLD